MTQNPAITPPPGAVDRETFIADLVAEHVGFGVPEPVARQIAEATIEIADAVQATFNEVGERLTYPMSEDFNAFVPFAVLRAASRLIGVRMQHTITISEQQMHAVVAAQNEAQDATSH